MLDSAIELKGVQEMNEVDATPELVELEWGKFVDAAVPAPILLTNEYHASLIFNLVDDCGGRNGLGIVICRPIKIKFGSPNDHGLPNHELFQYGLDYYNAYEVRDSPWIRRVYSPETIASSAIKHLVITFHDSTFECLTEDYQFQRSSERKNVVLGKVLNEITEDS
jgi:hypothetical protein